MSGGYSPSLWETIRQALIASNALQFEDESYQPISYKEAFGLATIGGAQVFGVQNLGPIFLGPWFGSHDRESLGGKSF